MLQDIKTGLLKIIMLPVLIPSTMLLSGCGTTAVTTQIQTLKPLPKLHNRPYMDFNRSANNENEASLLLLDWYQYTRELEIYIDYLEKGE
ncbi:MAG: hypothetical protein LUC34_02205 [Campylobacter sp.]|nr:hypothetical protein [Campylobacter sp.]